LGQFTREFGSIRDGARTTMEKVFHNQSQAGAA